jgi:hypothetical protein
MRKKNWQSQEERKTGFAITLGSHALIFAKYLLTGCYNSTKDFPHVGSQTSPNQRLLSLLIMQFSVKKDVFTTVK